MSTFLGDKSALGAKNLISGRPQLSLGMAVLNHVLGRSKAQCSFLTLIHTPLVLHWYCSLAYWGANLDIVIVAAPIW
jgi:hypothetical protein